MSRHEDRQELAKKFGATDIVARIIAPKLSEALNTPVIGAAAVAAGTEC